MKSACSPEPFLRTEQEEVKNDITFLNAARDVVAPYSTYGRCKGGFTYPPGSESKGL